MILIVGLNAHVAVSLILAYRKKGIAGALTSGAFFLMIFPEESKISIPGLFDMTTQRIVIVLLLFCASISSKHDRQPSRTTPLRVLLLSLIVCWAASTANSIALTVSIKAFISQILDYLALYFLVAKYAQDRDTVTQILFSLVIGAIVCSVFGLLEAYGHWTVISLFPATSHYFGSSRELYVDQARGLRVKSTFGHPILFGSALAMAIPITLYLITYFRDKRRKALLWLGLLIQCICIYKTGSRGPWIALSLSFVLLFAFGRRSLRKAIAVVVLLAIVVMATRPGIWETLVNDYTATLDADSYQGESYQYRYVLYALAVQQLGLSVERAVFGYGPESFYFLNLSSDLNGRSMAFRSCDSSFAALLIETGYVGFLIILLLLCSAFIRTFRAYRRLSSPDNQICIVLLANLLAFTFMMTNVAIFRWGQQAMMFWIAMALALTYPRIVKNAARQKMERHSRSVLVASAQG
jgi:O-antigen ligase